MNSTLYKEGFNKSVYGMTGFVAVKKPMLYIVSRVRLFSKEKLPELQMVLRILDIYPKK